MTSPALYRDTFVRWFTGAILLVLACLTSITSVNSDPLVLDDNQHRFVLDPHTTLIHDVNDAFAPNDLLTESMEVQPVMKRAELHLGYSRHPVWLRSQVRNDSETSQRWLVRFEFPFLDRVTLHTVRNGNTTTQHSGSIIPVEQRALPHRQPVFPLELAPDETVTLLAHVESQGSMMLSADLLSSEAFQLDNNRESAWLATYFGMLLALGLYNLLLSFGLKERVFLYYALFVFSFSLATLAFNGTGALVWGSALTEHTARLVALGFTLAAALATLFAQNFLDTATYSPRWHHTLSIYRYWCFTAAGLSLVVPVQMALQTMDLTGLVTCVLLLSCALYCSLKRVPGARLFMLAWTLLLVGASIFALRNVGLMPTNFFTIYGIQIGSALEMLLLSFALAARFNKLKKQKEDAQASLVTSLRKQEAVLEQKVAERTAELETMASSDMLTGLLNRNGLEKCAKSALNRSRRHRQPLTLFMLDLDNFKPINDQYGHSAGDVVLQEIAWRITSLARAGDHCARFGGDEFVVIAENTGNANDIETIRTRLAEAIGAPIRLPNNHWISVSVSIGSCRYHDGPSDLEELMRQADIDMYRTKGSTVHHR
ncbi:diguanylate cyclase [Aidingimonas lacisalsi]|uniref:diguanylate cyclase n=1 Tax=Aidingimonas lacisalsi TaxID=2604086 RepID=UPI001F448777|nr:diguanylate cyclase [Aidingimonas lacisalsi]